MVDIRYVLILLGVEKDRSAVAVDTGTVKCIFMSFTTSENSARDNCDPFRKPANPAKNSYYDLIRSCKIIIRF